jgi:hypothetical protein
MGPPLRLPLSTSTKSFTRAHLPPFRYSSTELRCASRPRPDRPLSLKLELGVSRSWWLLIFARWPRRSPLGRAENPAIAFIGGLKKQVRNCLVLLGEGQSTISDRAGVLRGRQFTHGRALPRRVQIALKPAAKVLGMHRIFVGGKGRKHVIADSALKRMQVHARSRRLNAEQHHPGFALRTGGALKRSRWNVGRQALGLGHGASLHKKAGAQHSRSPVLPGARSGDGASIRRRELSSESIRALAADRTARGIHSGWRHTARRHLHRRHSKARERRPEILH